MDFVKTSFAQGMNLQFDPTRIGDDQYPLLFNGRNRKGTITPVKKHLKLDDVPTGLKQGLYAAGQYLILFSAGQAYYKDILLGGNFTQIPGVALDPSVDVIYAAQVSDSSMNFARVPGGSGASASMTLTTAINKSISAMVCQDGVTQPAVIFPDGTGRITKRYDEWTQDEREYVPVGTRMIFSNGILYVASGRTLLRSVSGRPLDFMVNVNASGEAGGEASTVAHAIGFDPLTCLAAINSPDNGFYAATSNFSSRVVPDFDNTIFGEPQFDNIDLFPTGPVNQFSFLETLGDNVFVNVNGIRSFNAALQERNEGKNELFSAQVLDLFGDDRNPIVQERPCVAKFNNYLLFSVETVYGDAIVVYDETLKRFVALDQQDSVGRIKQFALVQKGTLNRLFFITEDDEVYEAYGADETATAKLYIGDYCSQKPSVNHLVHKLHVVVIDASEDGTLTVTPYVDGKKQTAQTKSKPITDSITDALPRAYPFGDEDQSKVQNFSFAFRNLSQGWKTGFSLELNCLAQISHIECRSEDLESDSGLKEEAQQLARFAA